MADALWILGGIGWIVAWDGLLGAVSALNVVGVEWVSQVEVEWISCPWERGWTSMAMT